MLGFRDFFESVTVRVADYNEEQPPESISYLGYAIISKLRRAVPEFNKGTNPEGFTIDGLDVDATEGVMNFYPQGIPDQAIPKILKAIKYYLGEFGAKFGEFKEDQSNMFKGEKVYRIRVQLTQKAHNKPPEINMANGAFDVVFHKVLNMPSNFGGHISARDLLIKIDSTSDFTISIQKSSTTKEPGKAKFIEFGIDEERIRRHLDGLRQLAKWAIDNDYDSLEFS